MKGIGRNAPCHCGSGKKYKKCCLDKDEKERRDLGSPRKAEESGVRKPETASLVQEAPEALEGGPGEDASDPVIEAMNARWEEFKKADYEGRLSLFARTLDEPELMDPDMAFDMLDKLYYSTAKRNERNRFDMLVDELRLRVPESYQKNAGYFLDWAIANAVIAGNDYQAAKLAIELSGIAFQNLDVLFWTVDRLAYHGQLPTLVKMFRFMRPEIKASSDSPIWGEDAVAGLGVNFEIFHHLEYCEESDDDREALTAQLNQYALIDEKRLAAFLEAVPGPAARIWTMEDFFSGSPEDTAPPCRKLSEDSLHLLSLEFLGYLRRVEGVPYTRGEIGRAQIADYIFMRYKGELEPRESAFESMARSRKHKPKKKPRPQVPHLFCPDPVTLDQFTGRLLFFANPQRYKVAATFELLPAWMRFLESRALIDEALMRGTLSRLRSLKDSAIRVLEGYLEDPELSQGIRAAWQGIP